MLPIRIEQVASSQCVFPIGKGVSDEAVASTLATIAGIDKKLSSLLNTVAERESAFFGAGEFSEEVPRGLQVDEVIELGANTTRQMEVVEDEK